MIKKLICIFLSLILTITGSVFVLASDNNVKVQALMFGKNENNNKISIFMPEFSGFENSSKINSEIQSYIKNEIGDINLLSKELKNSNTTSIATHLQVTYDYYIANNLISVVFNSETYSGGTHGVQSLNSINMNAESGEFYQFKDLFKDDTYKVTINNLITEEINRNQDYYYPNALEILKDYDSNYKFYIDGSNIVVYFNPYEIAPYAAGIKKFYLSSEILKDILKEDFYNLIASLKPLKNVRYNGKSYSFNKTPVFISDKTSEEYYVPMREAIQLLGHQVVWKNNKTNLLYIDGNLYHGNFNIINRNGIKYVKVDNLLNNILKENQKIYYEISDDGTAILRMFNAKKTTNSNYLNMLNYGN